GELGVELFHDGVVLPEEVLAQDAGLLVAIAAQQREGDFVLRTDEGESLVELAVVPMLVKDAHAVEAEARLAVRGEDPGPVAEDGAVFGTRDQRSARLAVTQQHDYMVGILRLQRMQEAFRQAG